jgi:integrase
MGHIVEIKRKRKGNRRRGAKTTEDPVVYKVRYRDPDRVERSRSFETKQEALRFLQSVETDIARGHYLDPAAGRATLDAWAQEWFSTVRHLKPKTQEGYRSLLRKHILPRLGKRKLTSIKPLDVRRLVSEMVDTGYSPSTVRQARHLLGMIMNAAVENGAIANSPVKGVKAPRVQRREMQVLTAKQVTDAAEAVPDRYKALVYLLAYGGLRWGEAAALRSKRLNLLRARVEVSESVADVSGHLHYGSTKTYQTRNVAVPGFLKDMLAQHLANYVGKSRDALVFTTEEGTPLRNSNWRRWVWDPALEKSGLPKVRIHDLRHTCATLLIAEGAHAKAIQRHLGHSSIQITFDTYGHLLPDEQDRVAGALDETFRKANGSH